MLHFWMSESVCLCMCELDQKLQQQKLSEAATTAAQCCHCSSGGTHLLMYRYKAAQ